ncbi:MAG: DUF2868 domain-containing protein [Burkholderiales bacterium]|nr:DUF2868 domain-containing protein [Burkholderiales bacterium]
MTDDTAVLDEATARRVLLVRACETAPAGQMPAALWSAEDAAWATRLANETVGAAAPAREWLVARARHACERLLARSKPLAAAAAGGGWRAGWVLVAALLGLGFGLAGDALGGRTLDLLAPPWLAVLGWNLLVYLAIVVHALRPSRAAGGRGALRRAVRAGLRGRGVPRGASALKPLATFAADWAERSLPLLGARAALLLHVAAAALAGGLIAGMYLRGLVFDLRAGWQSTFVEPAVVHALLATLLAPASWVTGIALPDAAGFAALRLVPGSVATASAAPWIHLTATTLALGVAAPRSLLALWNALVAARRARRFVIDLAEPYYQRLFTQAHRARARLLVLPHGNAPSPQAVLGLRELLARVFGEGVQIGFAPVVAYGDEETAATTAASAATATTATTGSTAATAAAPLGTTLRVALFDAAATPEPEAQGRFLAALSATSPPSPPLLVLVDLAEFERRFAALPARVAERRAAWQQLAAAHGLALAAVALQVPPPARAAEALEEALDAVLAQASNKTSAGRR